MNKGEPALPSLKITAPIGYTVATVFAEAAIVYHYALWITRLPTWQYFNAAWRNFLSWRNFRRK